MIITSFIRLLHITYIIIKYDLLTLLFKNKILIKILSNFSFIFFKKTHIKKRGYRLKTALEELGPIFIKLGQILSTRIDIIPNDIIAELKILQTNIKTTKTSKIKHIIKSTFKCNINNLFKKFNENPIASASIAQIHTGVLLDKKKVIIKIIKPYVKKKIKNDLMLLKLIAKIIHTFFEHLHRLKPIDIILELQNILNNELNLKKEAANLTKMKYNFTKFKHIYMPNIHWNLISENILIMEYIDGINITNIIKLKKQNLNLKTLSITLINFFYLQTLKYKFFHADLHPGNILIVKNTKNIPILTLLDFGIVSSLKTKERNYLTKNILAFAQHDYRKVAYLHMKNILSKKSIDDLEREICCVCEPILNKPIKNISFDKTLLSLINLTKTFKLQMQPKLILFQKTLMTIEALSRQLYPDLNLWKTTRQCIEQIIITNYSTKNLLKNLLNFSTTKNSTNIYKKTHFTTNFSFKKYIFSTSILNFILGYICGLTIFFIFLKYNMNLLSFLL